MNKSIFVFSKSDPKLAMEYDHYADLSKINTSTQYAVGIIDTADCNSNEIIYKIRQTLSQIILIHNPLLSEKLDDILQKIQIFKIVKSWNEPQLNQFILEAVEKSQFIKQNNELLQILEEQNIALSGLEKELQQRVLARKETLNENEIKLKRAKLFLRKVARVLETVLSANTIYQMEQALKVILHDDWGANELKISIVPSAPPPSDKHIYFDLGVEPKYWGRLFMIPPDDLNKDIRSFFKQIASAISIAGERILYIQELEQIKTEWQKTFDSLEDTVLLVDSQYVIRRVNHAISKWKKQSPSDLVGKKCYRMFFNRESPCKSCQLGAHFELPVYFEQKIEKKFDVKSHRFESLENNLFLNVYIDQLEFINTENRLKELDKMAELGIIGSSLAHELNNPIAGILTMTQVMLMDADKNSELHADLILIEAGARRCRDLIQQLLGFSRPTQDEDDTNLQVSDWINSSLKIIEPRMRLSNMKVEVDIQSDVIVSGPRNKMIETLFLILQKSFEEALSSSPPELKISAIKEDNSVVIKIENNGSKLATGLILATAYDVIESHGGSLEFFSDRQDSDIGTTRNQALIKWSRLVST